MTRAKSAPNSILRRVRSFLYVRRERYYRKIPTRMGRISPSNIISDLLEIPTKVEKGKNVTFNIFSHQHGAVQFDAVKADNTAATATDQTATSSDPDTLTVAPNPGFPTQFLYHSLKAGTIIVTAAGKNTLGSDISTDFIFNITDKPDPNLAVGFTGTLVSQVDD